jgi:hypothetical protein
LPLGTSSVNVSHIQTAKLTVLIGGHFCHPGCPLCPPGSGSGSGSGGSDSSSGDDDDDDDDDNDDDDDDDDNDDNSSSSTTTTTTDTSSIVIPGMATEIAGDPMVATTEAVEDINKVVTAISAQWISMFGTALPTATATGLDSGDSDGGGTSTTSSTGGSSTGLDFYTYSDPDNGLDGVYCQCRGYAGALPTRTGTASPCSYTTLPNATPTTTRAPTSDDPYPYTFTDLWGWW